MNEKICLIYTGIKVIVLLLVCWTSVNAENLCEHKRIIEQSGNILFVGCDNNHVISINLLGRIIGNRWGNWIFIVETIKDTEHGTYDFVLSEAYKITEELKYAALDPKFMENNDVLMLDTLFFQKGRAVFLQIHTSPNKIVLQLKEPLIIKKRQYILVTLNENIKMVNLQKADIFTSDSIKIPSITISRQSGLTRIVNAEIKNFHANLINNVFTINFDDGTFRFVAEHHQYKFEIP